MLVSACTLLGFVAIGLPVAVGTADDDTEPVTAAAVAATTGLLATLGAGLVLIRGGRYHQLVLLAALAAAWVGAMLLARRNWATARAAVQAWRPLDALALLPPVALLFVARSPAYFVFETGDMGEYLNSANVVADTGRLLAGFPHGFTVLLANTHLAFGEGAIDRLLPALGALLVLNLVAAARALHIPLAAAAAVGLVAALNPVTVWFSLFPVSETPYAAVLLGTVALVSAARRASTDPHATVLAAVAGVGVGALLLIRGNALLLGPVVVGAQVVSWLADRGRPRLAQAVFSAVALPALGGAYAYNVQFLPAYFVDFQLEGQLPATVFRRLGAAQLLGPSIVLAAALVAGTVLWWVALAWAARHEPRSEGRARPVALGALAVAVTATLAYVVSAGTGGTTDGFSRWGVGVALAAAAGLVTVAVVRRPPAGLVAWLYPVLVGLAGVALFAKRQPEARDHAYFLYIDRYLWSEGLPIALLLVGAALGAAWTVGRRRSPGLGAGALAVVVAVAVVPVLPTTALATEHRFLGDPYAALGGVADAVPPRSPIVFSGFETPPEGWFFPNTFRALATPLNRTFDRRVVNLPTDPFASDPRPAPGEIVELLSEAARPGVVDGYVLTARVADTGEPDPLDGYELVAREPLEVWIISRRVDPDEEAFRSVELVLEVYRVELDATV